ncbi:MAG: NAD-dependent epimerase/dehydratase family protein [Pseudomonadota bacterium]
MNEHTASTQDDLIAVTGATGFIGSHLLSRLTSENRHTRALVRQKRNRKSSLPSSTEIVEGTLGDRRAIRDLLKGADTCIHVAGATTSVHSSGFHEANVIGTYNVTACASAAGVKHLIYLSSQAARAPWLSDYAASKATSEAALTAFAGDMKITVIRPPAVIGAGDPMLQPMFNLIQSGWLPAPSEPKGRTRSFAVISVHDLVSQIIDSLDGAGLGERVIEPCSVASTNWAEIAATTSGVLDRKVRVIRMKPLLMKAFGACADGVTKLTRRPLPLSLSKVRELLAVDWTYDHQVRDAMTLEEIFLPCIGKHLSEQSILSGE